MISEMRTIAERAAARGERGEHFAERQHADELAVIHDHQRADVVVRHDLDRIDDQRRPAWS